jgi:prepilin-type N-terminal cleavage/methylation domain-containing protein
MRKIQIAVPSSLKPSRDVRHAKRGFSLTELMIAMLVFTIVAGAAFSLFGQQAGVATQQQTLSAVNIGLRNAISQMEMDMAGGGGNMLAGITQGAGVTPFNLSVIINNNMPGVAATCAPNTTTWAYPTASACYDSLTILSPNTSLVKQCGTGQTPPLSLTSPSIVNLASASTVTADDANGSANNAADLACFKNGDEVLFIEPTSSGNCDLSGADPNYCMNVVKLTADSTLSGGHISLQVSASGSTSTDPLGIVYQPGGTTYFSNALANTFTDSSNPFIVDLGNASNAVTYSVMTNPNNANDQQLVRCPGTTCTTANAQVVTDQVIGFKVGADIWNGKSLTTGNDIANFYYDASEYCSDALTGVTCTAADGTTAAPGTYTPDPYDYVLVRAVRVSVIARTAPQSDKTVHSVFLNGFDNGPYLVQQASAVVDLRNASNADSNN